LVGCIFKAPRLDIEGNVAWAVYRFTGATSTMAEDTAFDEDYPGLRRHLASLWTLLDAVEWKFELTL